MEKEFKIQGNQLTITIPDGMIIDEENSTFECIKFKPINKSKFSDYDGTRKIAGFFIDRNSAINEMKDDYNYWNFESTKGCFATEKQAKSALAMAQISQIMTNDERFGGVFTDEEWKDANIPKYCISKEKIYVQFSIYQSSYEFLAFHTADQRNLFFQENEQLVKDYLMID